MHPHTSLAFEAPAKQHQQPAHLDVEVGESVPLGRLQLAPAEEAAVHDAHALVRSLLHQEGGKGEMQVMGLPCVWHAQQAGPLDSAGRWEACTTPLALPATRTKVVNLTDTTPWGWVLNTRSCRAGSAQESRD